MPRHLPSPVSPSPLSLAAPLVLVAALLSGCSSSDSPSPGAAPTPTTSAAPAAPTTDPVQALTALEARYGARLGVYALDTGSGRTVQHRADERFAFASTVKTLAAGAVLRRDTDADLDRVVTYDRDDLLEYAPVTTPRVETGMPLRELVAAALQQSDNTAMNLLLERLGGPEGLEGYVRSLGDTTTSVDRDEPSLNSATPGDTRDTTTPQAIGTDLQRLLLGDALPDSREQLLRTLMIANTTGGPYVRAGVPAGWTVADKTGSGGHGTRNDIAVVWPPQGAPLVLSLLSDRRDPEARSDDALLADATRVAVAALRP